MRPYQTLLILAVAVAAALYFIFDKPEAHPRESDFVNCYVELAILQQGADTTESGFVEARDSILAIFGFTENSLLQLKAALNKDPIRLTVIWEQIEEKLRKRKQELGIEFESLTQ